jgi:two-component system, NarL family, response regulator NreC
VELAVERNGSIDSAARPFDPWSADARLGDHRRSGVSSSEIGDRGAAQEITIVLADDHAVVRAGLRAVLEAEPDLRVIGEADDVRVALSAVDRRRPAVLVLDLNMPGDEPLARIPDLRATAPQTAIVVLTMDDEPRHARKALEAGAAAYVLKEAAESRLIEAIRAAAAGHHYIDPELGGTLVGMPAGELGEGELSERDLELLRLVALGHTSREIADKLFLSVRTIEVERTRLQRQLGLRGRPELVRFALAHRLLGD